MEQPTYPDSVGGASVAPHQGPRTPPTMPGPHDGPRPHQAAQKFQNGRPNGANGPGRRGGGQGQPTALSTPGGDTNP